MRQLLLFFQQKNVPVGPRGRRLVPAVEKMTREMGRTGSAEGALDAASGDWKHLESNSSQMTLHDPVDRSADETEASDCGWWTARPGCLRRFAVPKWVLFWLCWAGALQGMVVNGFVNVVITTIERRFNLRSTETGLTAGAYDIASFLCLVPVSYFGGRPSGNKPRWLGWGMVVMGLGSFLFAVPHFTAGLHTLEDERELFCDPAGGVGLRSPCQPSSVAASGPTLSDYKYVFILAQLLHGAGATPLYTLGVTFLDENVQTKMSSVYVGVYYAMAIVGPAIGYLAGGQFLKIHTDMGKADLANLRLNPGSTVWVGAWWIGFLMAGALSLFVAIPILGFPKELPGSQEIRAQKISEAHQGPLDSSAVNRVGFGTSIKDLPKSLKMLLANPTFMFLNIAGAFEALLLSGFAAFLPKFIESQFNVGASWAALLVGSVIVSSGGGGTFLGGYLVKRFQLRCGGIIKLCVGFVFVSLISCFVFLMSCPVIPFAGVNTPYSSDSFGSLPTLNGSCSSHCHCSTDNYDPVCGIDNVIYYSPCHAGCTDVVDLDSDDLQKAFANCSCIDRSNATKRSDSVMATREPCQGQCEKLPIFLAVTFLFSSFTFLASMPALSATLRCVADQQRSFALGIQWIIVRLLGSIPAPIIFGVMMDATCVLWQDSCGHQGSCRAHDNFLMSRYVLIISMVGKILSSSCFFFAWFLYKPPPEDQMPTADRSVNVATISSTIKPDGSNGPSGEEAGNVADVGGDLDRPVEVEIAGQQHWARVLRTSAGL